MEKENNHHENRLKITEKRKENDKYMEITERKYQR